MLRRVFLVYILPSFFFFLPLAFCAPAAKVVPEEEKTVVAGVEDILQFDFQPGAISVGDPKLIKAVPRPEWKQVRIFPQKKGITSVAVPDLAGNVMYRVKYTITTNDLSSKVEEIRDLLFDVEGIVIKIVGDNIVIDGELVVPR